ncbi:MAG: GNAT family N-acetyltransferase [Rubricoccaceae bacterium]
MHVSIRTAGTEDAGALAALAARTFHDSFADENAKADMDAYVHEAFSPTRVHVELANPANVFLLALTEGSDELIGYAKLRTGEADPCVSGPSPVELHRLYVDQPAIGMGVGAALMEASLKAARACGHETLWLGVWEENPRAIAFYERWGFTCVGTHIFRLGSDDQIDLVMERPVELV